MKKVIISAMVMLLFFAVFTVSAFAAVTIAPGGICPGHSFVNGYCEFCGEADPDFDPCASGHRFVNGACLICGHICSHETYKYGACVECNERAPIYEPCLVFLRGIGNYASSVLDGIIDPVTKELTSHGKTVCSLVGFLLFGYVGIAVKDRSFMKGVKR